MTMGPSTFAAPAQAAMKPGLRVRLLGRPGLLPSSRSSRTFSRTFAVVFISVGAFGPIARLPAQALVGLRLTNVGDLGGVSTYSRAINNAGQVAGSSEMGP